MLEPIFASARDLNILGNSGMENLWQLFKELDGDAKITTKQSLHQTSWTALFERLDLKFYADYDSKIVNYNRKYNGYACQVAYTQHQSRENNWWRL